MRVIKRTRNCFPRKSCPQSLCASTHGRTEQFPNGETPGGFELCSEHGSRPRSLRACVRCRSPGCVFIRPLRRLGACARWRLPEEGAPGELAPVVLALRGAGRGALPRPDTRIYHFGPRFCLLLGDVRFFPPPFPLLCFCVSGAVASYLKLPGAGAIRGGTKHSAYERCQRESNLSSAVISSLRTLIARFSGVASRLRKKKRKFIENSQTTSCVSVYHCFFFIVVCTK